MQNAESLRLGWQKGQQRESERQRCHENCFSEMSALV
jgi:hypothetical protein